MMWGFAHSVTSWRCICRKGLCIASEVRHLGSHLLEVLVLGYCLGTCVVVASPRGVEAESEVLCVWFLVLKAGPSFIEAVSRLMEFPVGETNLVRQSAALFLAPEIHSKVIL